MKDHLVLDNGKNSWLSKYTNSYKQQDPGYGHRCVVVVLGNDLYPHDPGDKQSCSKNDDPVLDEVVEDCLHSQGLTAQVCPHLIHEDPNANDYEENQGKNDYLLNSHLDCRNSGIQVSCKIEK